MNAAGDAERVRAAIEDVLSVSLGDQPNPERENVVRWDSLAHLQVVFALEEEFDVRFSEREIAELVSVNEIVDVIRRKHAA